MCRVLPPIRLWDELLLAFQEDQTQKKSLLMTQHSYIHDRGWRSNGGFLIQNQVRNDGFVVIVAHHSNLPVHNIGYADNADYVKIFEVWQDTRIAKTACS